MRPASVLIAILFGSALAISFGLIATSIAFAFILNEQPSLRREMPTLLMACVWFVVLSGVSGAALYSTLKEMRWRVYAQGATALTLIAVGFAYWPK